MAKDDECLEAIKTASGGRIKGGQAEDLLDGLKNARDRIMREKGLGDSDALMVAAQQVLDDRARSMEESKYARMIDLTKASQRRQTDFDNIEKLMTDNPKMNRAQATYIALATKNSTRQNPMTGSYDNFENNVKLMHNVWVDLPERMIAKEGLTAYSHDPQSADNIRTEFMALSDKDGLAKPGQTGDGNAQKVAQIWFKANAAMLKAMRMEGVFIKDQAGYPGRRTYDPDKFHPELGGASFDEFKADVLKHWDEGRTLEGRDIDDPHQFIRDLYDNFRNGVHLKSGTEEGLLEPGFKPKPGKSSAFLKPRVIFWNGPEAENAIAKKYGSYDNFSDQMASAMTRSAKGYALIRQYGKDAAYWHEADIDEAYKRLATRDDNSAYDFNQAGYKQKLMDSFKLIDGTGDQPTYKAWANIERGMKAAAIIAHGPSIPLIHFFSAPATEGAAFAHYGSNRFAGVVNGLKTWLKILDPGARKQAADLAASFSEGVHGHLYSDFMYTDTAPHFDYSDKTMRGGTFAQRFGANVQNKSVSGGLSTLAGGMLKLGGLDRIMGLNRTFWEVPASKLLADHLGTDFDKLDTLHRSTLESNNIKAEDWKLLQSVQPQMNSMGIGHVTPPLAYRIDNEAVQNMLRARGDIGEKTTQALADTMTERYKDDLARRTWLYLNDGSKMALNLGTSRAREVLSFVKQNPQTQFGAAMRTMINLATFFKQWPTELIYNAYGRDVLRSGNAPSATLRAASTAAMLTVAGYMTLATNALRQGKEPPKPLDGKTWVDSALRGGAGTVVSDMVGSELSREGSFYERAGRYATGVGGTELKPLADLAADAFKGKSLGKDAQRLVSDNVPKLWYSQLGLNYLYLWNLYDTLDPGWAEKDEERQEKYGTPYISDTIRPTGGH